MARIPIILSVPTSGGGSTAAATYPFFTSGYKPPRQTRHTSQDIVANQNGVFKYRYDNGPGVYIWEPFALDISDRWVRELGGMATAQWERLQFMWRYTEGPLTMSSPDGVYNVDWADAPLERQLVQYPDSAGDKLLEYRVVVNFEEGG